MLVVHVLECCPAFLKSALELGCWSGQTITIREDQLDREFSCLDFIKYRKGLHLRAAGRMMMKLSAPSDKEQNLFDLKEQVK